MNPKDPIIYRDPVIFTITERKKGEVAINTQHPAGQEHLKGRQNVWRKMTDLVEEMNRLTLALRHDGYAVHFIMEGI